ncbi:DUF3179 domain-containing protein [Haloarchaeobius sp. TZWSO28]|uniref:DUF3179 domain-containing protein n=1 Tax=Haloarchaeobius sp. TZWSO28 TaxID=3446119 RepID=UPI003EB76194
MGEKHTRRAMLAAAGGGLVGLAGCLGAGGGNTASVGGGGGGGTGTTAADTGSDPTAGGGSPGTAVPLADERFTVEYDYATLNDWVRSGGPPKDGIPSIDEPTFEAASTVGSRVRTGDPVFGVELNGETKAYPQSILVWHEIVNDTFGDENVTVSYCPLTGTAIGYLRGDTEFGVSGNLLNSNLVMYDRETDSRWPQVMGTAISGGYRDRSLQHVRVTWTTWDKWKAVHPDTTLLTEDTGYIRDYGRDPYGTYNPKAGYYKTDGMLFEPEKQDGRHAPKMVVIGARTGSGAFAVSKIHLSQERVVTGMAGDVPVVAVYEPDLDTGYVYRADSEVVAAGEQYEVDGKTHTGDALPLESIPAFDAMWFAWFAFYPSTEIYV